jgi:branched-chain amino acid transport system permease protein
LIFGLMRVVNMAHGSLYLFGGYIAWEAQSHWFSGGTSQFQLGGTSTISVAGLVVPLVFATVVIGLVGLGIQQVFLRWNQGQDLRQALITIAISVIFADQMIAHYGGVVESIQQPTNWPQSIVIGSFRYGFFRVAVVLAAAVVIGLLLYGLIKRTRFGMIIRAGVDDRGMTSALGINVPLVFGGAFFIGAALAGLGGVMGGTTLSLAPGQDDQFLLSSLVVVIVGGLGSLRGAAAGALLLGLIEQLSAVYLPQQFTNDSILLTFILLVVVLAVRPAGLFGSRA